MLLYNSPTNSRLRSQNHSSKKSPSSHSKALCPKLFVFLGALLVILLAGTLIPSQLLGLTTSSAIQSVGRIGLDWLHTQDKNVVNSQGNRLILRGANFMGYGDHHSEQDYVKMASWGFNVVRLPIAWQYIEPQPGVFNSSYLKNNVGQDIAWAKKYGIHIILDIHQWYWSPYFINNSTGESGNGMPWWLVSGYPQDYTSYQQAITDFWLGKAPNGTEPTLSNPSMQDRFINAWKVVASTFKNEATVAAYDILNEPSRGSLSISQQPTYLYVFYDKLIPEIRKLDSKHIIMYEHSEGYINPYVRLLNYSNIVFSFHFYRLRENYDGNRTNLETVFNDVFTRVSYWNIPVFIGEFNTHADYPNAAAWTGDTVSIFSEQNLSWTWWSYYRSDYDQASLCYQNGTERVTITQYLKLQS